MGKNYPAPGFRFHPTDLELVLYYLKRKVLSKKFPVNAPITEVDIYKHAPWDLPGKSCLKTGDLKWYFFCPIAKKYGKGGRLNRATVDGYWKTTGKDRPVKHNGEVVGMKKTLVFHRGKSPSGERTDWVMHEYKLEDKKLGDRGIAQDSYVLCEVFEKEGLGPKNGAQYGAPFKEEDWSDDEEEEEEETILPGTTSLLCNMSAAAVGGASSSLVHESHVGPSVGSSGLYNLSSDTGTSTIDTTAYAPTSAYAAPTWTSALDTTAYAPTSAYAAHTWTSAIDTTAYAPTSAYAVPTWTSAIDTTAYALTSAPTSAYAASTWTSGIDTSAYSAPTWTSGNTFAYASTSTYAAPTWTSAIDTFADAAPTFVDAHPEAPLVADPETVADAQTVADAETVPAFLKADVARDEEPNSNILTLLDSFHANDTFLHRDDQIKLPQVSNEDNDVASLLKSFTEVDDPSTWSYIF